MVATVRKHDEGLGFAPCHLSLPTGRIYLPLFLGNGIYQCYLIKYVALNDKLVRYLTVLF